VHEEDEKHEFGELHLDSLSVDEIDMVDSWCGRSRCDPPPFNEVY
jgi:hypothetical protein